LDPSVDKECVDFNNALENEFLYTVATLVTKANSPDKWHEWKEDVKKKEVEKTERIIRILGQERKRKTKRQMKSMKFQELFESRERSLSTKQQRTRKVRQYNRKESTTQTIGRPS